ncbi:MAG: RidA family protein [Amphritea sp.]
MTIEHIRSNHRMSGIVKHNGTVYLSGRTAGSEEWDTAEQTRRCLQDIDGLLEEAGTSKQRLLSVAIYLRDMKDFAVMNEVWDAWVAGVPTPARVCVEAHLARPIVKVEVCVIAAQ